MSIISFWNESEKENGQTSSIIAIATQMAIEHNFRILLVDCCLDDSVIEKAFWKPKESKTLKKLTAGKIDISSGAEGLVSAVASNKATPEIITNYTKIVFKNRLDILLGLKTTIPEEHEKSLMLYKDLLASANKFYDLVFVDLSKSLKRPSTKAILEKSNLVVYTMPPNLANIDNYRILREKNPLVGDRNVIPLLAKSDEASGYNVKNTTRYIKEKGTIATIPYNVRFMEATNEARTAEFFTRQKLTTGSTSNDSFFEEVERCCLIIINKLKELNV
jgi:cellulose biosynthesis protein BcsQ